MPQKFSEEAEAAHRKRISYPMDWYRLLIRASNDALRRRSFDAVARTASSLKRDRRFADSPLEGDGFEPSVPPLGRHFFETTPEPGN
jgi:hypothetical protein